MGYGCNDRNSNETIREGIDLHKLDIKPLSVNRANTVIKGQIRKTREFKKYVSDIHLLLPKIVVPEGKLKLSITFGFSSNMSDIDNPVKPFQDCLQKKYGFNDRDIYKLHLKKELVKKGHEFIKFDIVGIP